MNILLYGELQNVNSLRNNIDLGYRFLYTIADPQEYLSFYAGCFQDSKYGCEAVFEAGLLVRESIDYYSEHLL